MNGKKLFAIRGASQCLNTVEDITRQVTALYREVLERNNLDETGIVSLVFSVTEDLDAKNPAAALRAGGFAADTALFVVQEARFTEGLERTVRLLLHCYLDENSRPFHVYRNGAEVLRPDRACGRPA